MIEQHQNISNSNRPKRAVTFVGVLLAILLLVFYAIIYATAAAGLFSALLTPEWTVPALLTNAGVFTASGLFFIFWGKSSGGQFWQGLGFVHLMVGGYLLLGSGQTWLFADLSYGWRMWMPLIWSAICWLVWRRYYIKQSVNVSIMAVAFVMGALTTWAFLYAGQFGTGLELLMSLVETAGLTLFLGLAITLPLQTARAAGVYPLPVRRMWMILTVGLCSAAILPNLMLVRGYWVQGQRMAAMMSLTMLAAAAIAVLPRHKIDRSDVNPQPPPLIINWGGTLIFIFISWLIPLTLTEAFENDFMFTDFIFQWLFTLPTTVVITLIWLVILIFMRYRPAQFWQRPALPLVLTAGILISAPIAYSGTLPETETIVVVLRDQADTTDLAQIDDYFARRTAVYEHLTEFSAESQQDIRAYLNENQISHTPFYLINGLEVSASRWQRWQLARRDDVAYILESPQPRPLPVFNPFANLQPAVNDAIIGGQSRLEQETTWGIRQMAADRAWNELDVTGEGIVVGVADSGIEWTHDRLRSAYRGQDGQHNFHWFDPAEQLAEPVDLNGHGTHTSGSVLGQGGIGVAPGSTLIGCRNLPRNLGNPADYLACMQFLLVPFPLDGDPFIDGVPELGAHITNNSWGCPPEEGCDGQTLGIATQHIRHAGQMMVVSNGNDGPGCETTGPPASNDAVFSVGAINVEEDVVSFSSRGPAVDSDGDIITKPDIVAPGADVISAWPNNTLFATSGTSMAGPHVAGLVALIWSANADLIGDIDLTEQIIRETTVPVSVSTGCGSDNEQSQNVIGFGAVNAYEAVRRGLEMNMEGR